MWLWEHLQDTMWWHHVLAWGITPSLLYLLSWKYSTRSRVSAMTGVWLLLFLDVGTWLLECSTSNDSYFDSIYGHIPLSIRLWSFLWARQMLPLPVNLQQVLAVKIRLPCRFLFTWRTLFSVRGQRCTDLASGVESGAFLHVLLISLAP